MSEIHVTRKRRNLRIYFQHLPHYLPLIGIFTAGILAFLVFSYDRQFQIGVALSLAAGHLVWGVVHHFLHDDLSPSVILEYIAVAIFGLVVLLSLILRA